MTIKSFLALGDSYTVGEGVIPEESFPFLTAKKLRAHGHDIATPDVVAKTGWTTDELASAVAERKALGLLRKKYDLVTLLIGVNNQYRGRTADDFGNEFRALLNEAILFAGKRHDRVFVLSIPDWGRTPFATGRDRDQISKDIDAFNRLKEQISSVNHVSFIDITPSTREHANDVDFLTTDGLHPSTKEYELWADKLAKLIETKN